MNRRPRPRRANAVRQKLAANPAALVQSVVSQEEVEDECRALGHKWRQRVFTPIVTLWTFLAQVLDVGAACTTAVAKVLSFLSVTQGLEASHDASAYCRARRRLPEALLPRLARKVAAKLAGQVADRALWHGHRVKLVDGSSVTMADTPANQAAYPQPKTQAPGCGFPMARLVALFDLITGAVVDLALGPLDHSERTLFHNLWHQLGPNEVVVGDRWYGSYAEMALLAQRGVHGVWRLHHRRKADFRRGVRLGRNDRRVTWTKGQRPGWLSREDFAALPDTLAVRLVRTRCQVPGWRVDEVVVVTTLLDPKAYPARDIAALFLRRWEVETDLDHLKTTLDMEFLRTKSPAMVRRDLWAHLLAYNLIRTLLWEAGTRRGIPPLRLSFQGALDEVMAMWPLSAGARRAADLRRLFDQLVHHVATHKITHRPHRSEPRVRKRRPKSYPLMTKPRSAYKKNRAKARA
jgi:hypothetical protein